MATGGSDVSLGSMTDKRENLTCALCLEIFRDPKLLPCSHTYCKKCLDDLIKKAPDPRRFPCPKDVQVPKRGASAFQTNFYIDPEDLKRARDRTLCTFHPQKKYDMFCVECDILICMDCKLADHLHHASKTLDDAAKLASDQLTEDRVRLEKALADLEKNAQFRETDQTDFKKKKEVVEQEIRQRHSTLMAAADKYRDDALAELEDSFAQKAKTRTLDLDAINKNMRELQRLTGNIDRAKQQDQKQEIVMVAKEMRSGDGSPKTIEKLMSVPHLTQVSRPVHRSKVDDAVFDRMKNFIGKAEYLHFDVSGPEVKIATQFRCEGEDDIVTAFFVCPKLNGAVYVSYDPSYNESAPKTKKYFGSGKMHSVLTDDVCVEVVGRVSMFMEDNALVYYTDNGATKCSKMKPSDQQYTSCLHGTFTTKIQVASDEKANDVLISCGSHRAFDVDADKTHLAIVTESEMKGAMREVKLFKLPKKYGYKGNNRTERAVDTYCSPITPFKPADVCFFSLQGQMVLLIADEHNDAIHVVDVQGDKLTFSRFLAPGNPHLLQPTALNTDHLGRLWVACRGARMVVFQTLDDGDAENDSVAAAAVSPDGEQATAKPTE